MKYCVLVIAIGDIFYKDDAKEILVHYFNHNNIPYVFLEENPLELNYKKAHPSWLKMICHRIFPGYDTIISWDLDLLPKSLNIKVIHELDLTKLSLAIDDSVRRFPLVKYSVCPDFKYNCGLISIPKSYSDFTENIYDTFAPGSLQFWEQFYFNNMVSEENKEIHVLPDNINVFFGSPNFKNALLQHYTNGDYAKHYIPLHKYLYFSDVSGYIFPKMYETRLDMIYDLVQPNGTYCEIGVFKGNFTKEIMKLEPKQFVLLDLFSGIIGSGDENGNNFETINLDESYKNLQEYFSKNPEVSLIKGDSSTNLSMFPSDTFDMIYIDGDHEYEGCKKDLIVAYDKIKNGGWIMGHDYEMNMLKAKTTYIFGVRNAVDEFCNKYNQVVYAKAYDGCVSYAIHVKKL